MYRLGLDLDFKKSVHPASKYPQDILPLRLFTSTPVSNYSTESISSLTNRQLFAFFDANKRLIKFDCDDIYSKFVGSYNTITNT